MAANSAEVQKESKNQPSPLQKALEQFGVLLSQNGSLVSTKLSTVNDLFDKVKLATVFTEFLEKNPEYVELTLKKSEILATFSASETIQNIILQKKTEYELSISALESTIQETYTPVSGGAATMHTAITRIVAFVKGSKKYDALTIKELIKSRKEMDRLIEITLVTPLLKIKERSTVLDKMAGLIDTLSEKEKAQLEKLKEKFPRNLSEKEISTVIGIVAAKDKTIARELIQMLIPSANIATYLKYDIISETEVTNVVLNWVRTTPFYADLRTSGKEGDYENFIKDSIDNNSLDLFNIEIPSASLTDDQINKAIASSFVGKKLLEEIEEGLEEISIEINKDLEITPKDGESIPNAFFRSIPAKIRKNIQNIDTLKNTSVNTPRYIRGEVPDPSDPESKIPVVLEISKFEDKGKDSTVKISAKTGIEFETTKDYSLSDFYDILEQIAFTSAAAGVYTKEENSNIDRNLAKIGSDEALKFDTNGGLVQTLQELTLRLDEVDLNGKWIEIKKGMVFQVEKEGGKNYNIGVIEEVLEAEKKVRFKNTKGEIEELSFSHFAILFKEHSCSRSSESFTNPNNLVHLFPDLFKGVEYDKDRRAFIHSSRKEEKKEDYSGIKYFLDSKGNGYEVDEITENGNVKIRSVETEESKDKKDAKKKTISRKVGRWENRPLFVLHYLLKKDKIKTIQGDPKKDVHETIKDGKYKHTGVGKRIFAMASFGDVVSWFKQVPEFFKDKLKQGSHFHSARMALGFAKMIPGMPEEWMAEFKDKVNNANKKKVEELLGTLNGFPSPKRHEQVLSYLENGGTHEYELIAGILSLLEKHGNLYPGKLKEFEGQFRFFRHRAIPGSAKAKDAFIRDWKQKNPGKPCIEQEIIFEWLKFCSGKEAINPLYWNMVKKNWRKGAGDEMTNGGTENEAKTTWKDRNKYAIDKFKDREYGHAIGAMEKSWKLSGKAEERMKLPFMMALSNIHEHVHMDLLQKFKSFYADGHIFPPLLFIETEENRAIFQRTMEVIVQGDPEMATMYYKGVRMSKSGDPQGLSDFWDKYGSKLTSKLAISANDPEIFLKKDSVPIYGEYFKVLKEAIDGKTPLNGDEIDSGVYETSSMGWGLIHSKKFIQKIELNAGPGALQGGANEAIIDYHLKLLKDNFEMIRNYKKWEANPNSPEILAEKKMMYKEFHRTYLVHLHTKLGWGNWNGKYGDRSIDGAPFVADFVKNFGFSLKPGTQNEGREILIDDARYESEWLDGDFNRFINGGNATNAGSHSVKQTTYANVDDILANKKRMAANNESYRKTA